jgi:hypothetical protein
MDRTQILVWLKHSQNGKEESADKERSSHLTSETCWHVEKLTGMSLDKLFRRQQNSGEKT